MKNTPSPPNIALLLLRLTLPEDVQESVIGDLEEEMAALTGRNPLSARLWFFWHATVISGHYFVDRRLRRARGRPVSSLADAGQECLISHTENRKRIRSMSSVWQDLHYALRLMRKSPGFTAVAVISLALGIGANTAIFQLLNAVRLRSLPVPRPNELAEVKIANSDSRSGSFSSSHSSITNPQWEYLRDHQEAFSGVFAWSEDTFNLAEGGQVRPARGLWVSGDFFKVLGVAPVLGRVFTPADDKRGCGTGGVVISNSFWRREFGGAPGAVGGKLTLEGQPFEIIGVTPPGFFGLEVGRYFDVAVPICAERTIKGEYSRLDMRHGWWLTVMGRLKPEWTIDQASAQLAAISPALFQETVPPIYNPPGKDNYLKFKLGAFPDGSGVSNLRDQYEYSLWLLLGIAGLVLLIACANLANLMLARASVREREIAVRLALGASRGRLIRQLLAESLLLAAVGAVIGAIIAQGLSRFLVSFISQQGRALFLDLSPDWRLLAFMAGLAVFTCILFGLTPAFRATRTTPGAVLKAGGRGLTASRERFGLRRILVVSQVAISMILLVGAILFARSLQKIMGVDPGFKQDGVMTLDLDFSKLKLPKDRRLAYKRDLLDRVRAIPGVDSAADARIVPLSGNGWNDSVEILGSAPVKQGVPMFNRVTPDFFKTLGATMVAGRDFNDHDTLTAQKVAIVNETFVRQLLDGHDPIGKRFQVETPPGEPALIYEIIGLVKDTKYYNLRENFRPTAFVAASQTNDQDEGSQFIINSSIPAGGLTAAVRRTILEASPDISLDFHIFKTQIRDGLLQERLMATLSGFFGLLAVLLATVGLYGVLSYTVAQRRNEIGIRMSLGADRLKIVKLIMGDAGILLAVGLGVGLLLALLGAKAASSMLFGLKPSDPVTIALAIAALGAVGTLAGYLPARRAAGQDPMAALRDE
jgi:putative ABC transport system permease protein